MLFAQFANEADVAEHFVFGERSLLLLISCERAIFLIVVFGVSLAAVFEFVFALDQQKSTESLREKSESSERRKGSGAGTHVGRGSGRVG